ncbi:hypothetical protein CR205_01715 [Alteribacter lacisalsi]|uniref:Integron-associated effector binding protein domain-containing protein n=1 Tax=Alteribacter lacisalsi TaxID=2045244 RepID=A0A2W0H9A3_9BACI|nr:hypothetical protein CR205_01715 [Alteribacter lacisalsi]
MSDIPEEMIGFTLPAHDYAVTACTNRTVGEGYKEVHEWIACQERSWNRNACSIECYFNRESEDGKVEIYVPLKRTENQV